MHTRRQFLYISGAASAIALMGQQALAGEPKVFQSGGVAINGYDPVAYFTDEMAVEGSGSHTHDWNGATWRFASAAYQQAFAADPAKYAPQYGGYCAYAVSKGYTASTDPYAWTVFEGKLYLNYSKSVRSLWSLRRSKHIENANTNWPSVLG